MNATLLGATFTALAVVTLAGAPLAAQRDSRGSDAYDAGYRDGARAGGDDARDGRRYEYQRHRDYREADGGYGGRAGRRDASQDRYRAGFVAGYRDGFYSGGGRSNGVPGYGSARRGGSLGRAAIIDVARSNGFEEGYRRGVDDGRDRDRPDLWRHRVYRNANRGYRSEYGPRGLYEQAFRSGFERGYHTGYRDGRRPRGRGGVGFIFRW